MQIIIDMLQSDIVLMFVLYLGASLALLAWSMRADCRWNQQAIQLSRARMCWMLEDNNAQRLRELMTCSVQHDLTCRCFLHSKAVVAVDQVNAPLNDKRVMPLSERCR